MCNCSKNLEIITANQQKIYDMLKEIKAQQSIWTEERICWLEEQVLRNGLETKNHDIKIVRMLESIGAISEIADDSKMVAEVKTVTKKKGVN